MMCSPWCLAVPADGTVIPLGPWASLSCLGPASLYDEKAGLRQPGLTANHLYPLVLDPTTASGAGGGAAAGPGRGGQGRPGSRRGQAPGGGGKGLGASKAAGGSSSKLAGASDGEEDTEEGESACAALGRAFGLFWHVDGVLWVHQRSSSLMKPWPAHTFALTPCGGPRLSLRCRHCLPLARLSHRPPEGEAAGAAGRGPGQGPGRS